MFVWNHINHADDDWKDRAISEPVPQHHLPLLVIRLSAPEAVVVVIREKEEELV